MRYPREETAERHERILEAASHLFRAHGFDGVSVAEVMREAGLTHGGFYAHFATKDDLAAAALDRALDGMLALADRAAEPGSRDDFIRHYASRSHRDNVGQGCAMGALAPEIARGSSAVRRTFTAKLDALFKRLAPALAGRPEAGRPEAARDEAIAMTATLVGALVLARAVDDPALSAAILAAARSRFGIEPEG